MEIQGVDEENEISQLAQSNEESTILIEDVRTLHPRKLEYCRLCAMPCSCTVSIFDKQGLEMNLANKINMNLPILVTEDSRLPLHVCWDCIKQLNASIKFVKQCLHAQFKIGRMFKDSLKGRDSTQIPIISNEKNVDAEECSSISRYVSNQLLSKEITSKDGSLGREGKNIIDLTTEDTSESSNLNDNNQNRLLSSFSKTKDKEDEKVTNGIFQEKYIANKCDSENEDNGADQGVEDLAYSPSMFEQDLDKSNEGFSLSEVVRYKTKNKTLSDGSSCKQNNQDWFWCKYCNRYFLHKSNLNQHQIVTHPTLVFQCSYCSKIIYEIKEDFIRHENSHECPPKEKNSNKSESTGMNSHSEQCTSNEIIDSKISHIPHEKQQWIKDILSGKLPKSCESKRNEVSNVENEENIRMLEDISCNGTLPNNVSQDTIENNSNDMGLNEQKKRMSGEKEEVVEKSKPFSLRKRFRWKPDKYPCNECKVEYNTRQDLTQHHRQYHIPRYPCRFCPRTMSFRKELDHHELCHITGKKHKCRRCPESYDTSSELNQHRIAKHMDNPPFRCKTCKKPFFREHIYLQHVKSHCLGNRFLCEMCGKAFSLRTTLRSHRKMYCKNPEEKKLSCQFCGRMFYHMSHLKVHVRTHTGEKPYLCSFCGKQYLDDSRLKYHLESHYVSKHACSFCGQLFLRNDSLKSHLKRHGNCRACLLVFDKKIKQHLLHRREFHAAEVKEELEKGFGGEKLVEFADGGGKIGDFSKTVVKCEKCTRNFASVFWLRSHQKGGCIDQPIFNCPICEKITRREDSYKKHMLSHSKNKSHQCSQCLQTFNSHKDLVEHEIEHKGSKPFSCPECRKCFRSSANLAKHLITHSTGRIYSCKHCDEYFTTQVLLLIHERKHNVQCKQVSPYPNSVKKSLPRLKQIFEIPQFVEQEPSKVINSMLNENYILNIDHSEESYTGNASEDNIASEILVNIS